MEKPFERDVLDRLIKMETKIDTITSTCPQCQATVSLHGIAIATIDASTKSAHHRIDSVYKTVGVVAGIVSAVIGGVFTLLNYVAKG